MDKKNAVVGIGEVLYDVLPDGPRLGGAPANFAFHVSQMGLPAVAISAVGNDALGDQALEIFREKALPVIMPRVAYPTGTVNVCLDDHGVPTYRFAPDVAWDHIPFTPEMEAVARKARCVCFGSLAQRGALTGSRDNTIRRFLDATPPRCIRIFDVNLRQRFYSREVLEDGLRRATILKINDEEQVELARLFADCHLPADHKAFSVALFSRYSSLQMVILTCGTEGSHVFSRDGQTSFRPTPHVKVADTVGAGDSFTAAFAAALVKSKTLSEAHSLAVRVSAYVCTQQGAMPRLPEDLRAE